MNSAGRFLAGLLLGCTLAALAMGGMASSPRVQALLGKVARRLWPAPPAVQPHVEMPMGRERADLRHFEVAALRARAAAGDAWGEAAINAAFAQEALGRADRVVEFWLRHRSAAHGLFPREIDPGGPNYLWNYADVAADCYSHFVIQSLLYGARHRAALREILETERRLNPALPFAVDLNSGAAVEEPVERRVFGAVEYAKDGLLPILEAAGETEWYARLQEIAAAVIREAPVTSRFGTLPSGGAEKNGEFLQVMARLFRKTGRPEYLEMGRRIADAYAREVLPANGWLPAEFWDFAAHRAVTPHIRLRDHGNEMVAGMVEWYLVERGLPDGRAEAYRSATESMLDTLLEKGRHADGMWFAVRLDTSNPPEKRANGLAAPNDNWGYLYAAYVAYARSLPEGSAVRERYLGEARRMMRAVTEYRGVRWEGGRPDGYCDALESAMYLLEFLDDPELELWIDDQIGVLFAFQKGDGRIEGCYLDGNFVRTSLLYARLKGAGARLDPWAPATRIGAARRGSGGVRLHIETSAPWSGRVVFDHPRHAAHIGLTEHYPRLNAWPEWFTVRDDARYEIAEEGGAARVVTGREMRDGVPLSMAGPSVVRWTVRPAAP